MNQQKFEINEAVTILQYKDDQYNREGTINSYNADTKLYWVVNMNMPYLGTVSAMFNENELEKV